MLTADDIACQMAQGVGLGTKAADALQRLIDQALGHVARGLQPQQRRIGRLIGGGVFATGLADDGCLAFDIEYVVLDLESDANVAAKGVERRHAVGRQVFLQQAGRHDRCMNQGACLERIHVLQVGPAGEKGVRFSALINNANRANGRTGMGAVMGSKNLKAIAVRGTGDINVARPEEFFELCNEVLEYIKWRNDNPIPGVMPILAGLGSPQEMQVHDEKWHTENFMWGNSRTRRKGFWNEEVEKQWTDTMTGARTRLISCYNCPMKCGATISLPGIPTYMMKCFSKLTYTMAAMSDLDFGLRIAQRATEYGVDGFSTPQVMAFALELYAGVVLGERPDLKLCLTVKSIHG